MLQFFLPIFLPKREFSLLLDAHSVPPKINDFPAGIGQQVTPSFFDDPLFWLKIFWLRWKWCQMTSADLSIQTLCPHYYLSGPLKKRLLVPNSVTESEAFGLLLKLGKLWALKIGLRTVKEFIMRQKYTKTIIKHSFISPKNPQNGNAYNTLEFQCVENVACKQSVAAIIVKLTEP